MTAVPTDTLTLRELNRATLARQMLLARQPLSAALAVERLCGLQAQEAQPPFVALWSRVSGFTRADLHRALRERQVVRATLMRATLHLLTAADYTAFRAALQPALTRAMRVLGARAAGLDLDAVLPYARALWEERPRSFEAIRGPLAERFPQVDARALGYAVRTHLPLVMVPTEERWAFPAIADFTPAESWVGRPLAPAAAPDALVLRYLSAFGPATPADVQTWSGLSGMKPVLDAMAPRLRILRDERGRRLFDAPDAPLPDADTPAPPRFLPEFDSLVLAHADRRRIIADEHRALLVTRNLRVRATFLWDGFAAGTWEVRRAKGVASLRLAPFRELPRAARTALADEGERLLRFVEEDAAAFEVEWTSPA